MGLSNEDIVRLVLEYREAVLLWTDRGNWAVYLRAALRAYEAEAKRRGLNVGAHGAEATDARGDT